MALGRGCSVAASTDDPSSDFGLRSLSSDAIVEYDVLHHKTHFQLDGIRQIAPRNGSSPHCAHSVRVLNVRLNFQGAGRLFPATAWLCDDGTPSSRCSIARKRDRIAMLYCGRSLLTHVMPTTGDHKRCLVVFFALSLFRLSAFSRCTGTPVCDSKKIPATVLSEAAMFVCSRSGSLTPYAHHVHTIRTGLERHLGEGQHELKPL